MSSALRPGTSYGRPSRSLSISLPCPPSRASTTDFLTPVRNANLNDLQSQPRAPYPQTLLDPKKRRRDAPRQTTDGLLKAPIVLRPHPSSLTAKPSMLHPLMLLPREHLPLSALDFAKPHGDLPSSRLFESKIKILDLEGRLGSNVLLARSETTRMVYAVEHESPGLYALCKLGAWTDLEDLSQHATVVYRERMIMPKPVKIEEAASAPLITPHMYNENKRRRLAIEELQSTAIRKRSSTITDKDLREPSVAPESMPPSRAPSMPPSRGSSNQNTDALEATLPDPPLPLSDRVDTPAPQQLPEDEPHVPPTAEAILDNIRTQYFEALYHSKGSLAYFAKGPLSRARAAYNLDLDSSLDMCDLIEFLKGLVITTVLIDKKYRETVPAVIDKMKTFFEDSEDAQSKRKKKKTKKPKIGKDGLYPAEVEHVRRWWSSHLPAARGDEERTISSTEVRYHISCLRRRETELQMILILEILALEPVLEAKKAADNLLLPGETQAPAREDSQELPTKKRSKHNFPTLLEVHADRLCIWHSITLDEVKALAESQMPTESEKPERVNSDPLRDFCVDIIIPFFSARLPELCDSMNRKLGGPVVKSPPKKEFVKPAVSSKPKPGAPMKRPIASLKKDSDKSLERALSNERMRRSISREPSKAIALMRSASTTSIPGLKRETSEPLLGMIPRMDKGLLKERRPILSRSTSSAGVQDLKARKKAEVEAELKDAISALKKPNRALAVKELADAIDKRASGGITQLKKLKKPARLAIPSVQVKATPANNRFRDAIGGEKGRSQQPIFSLESIPSSAVVPASTLHGRFTDALATSSVITITTTTKISSTETAGTIQATPAKAVRHNALQAIMESPAAIPDSSPIMARKAGPVSRPSFLSIPRNKNSCFDLPSSPGLPELFETPIAPKIGKKTLILQTPIKSRLPNAGAGGGISGIMGTMTSRKEPDTFKKTTTTTAAVSVVEKENDDPVSIYARLGWDDDDLDELA
ncbi:DNA replication regulator SLD3-domain-containing protein [Podospora fimiseda]|uniref:DNA replication regulator SLD3-domain-containing protein n=1 Tax=Podospora fimiseda TaxID=252190 RepID=A0AAN7H8E6_9PEZI|nr:DNA replication regulator SLD3-domain-containing protein [Podospora fimiseda]